ncbi:hypothetical protein Tco_0085954 [Tanacetum coccineum]
MDDLNITMEEYIRLEEEKARKHGKVFNWETAKYVSFDDSDDEDYTVIFDKNSFSYKIISVNDLKTDLENDNEKVNMPSFPPPEPTVSCFDDLDFFKDFENEFPAIVYNNAQTSKSNLLTEPILNPQHIDEFNLKDETSLSECDEEEQNVLNFNDLFPFNVIYPNDSKSDKDNDDDKVDIEHSSGDLSVKPLPDVINTDVGAYAHGYAPLPPHNHRHLWLHYQDLAKRIRMVYTRDNEQEVFMSHAWRRLFGIQAPLVQEFILEFFSTCRIRDEMGLDVAGLHTTEEMAEDGFGAYWLGSERVIPDKGILVITGLRFLLIGGRHLKMHTKGRKSSAKLSRGHFIGRLAHHFGLVSDDGLKGLSIVTRELSLIDMGELVKLNICKEIGDDWAWIALGPERQQVAVAGAPRATKDAPVVNEGVQANPTPMQALQQPPPSPLIAGRTMPQRLGRIEEEVQGLRQDVRSLRDCGEVDGRIG